MENNTIHTGENAKTILKQHALKFLPQNLGEISAQKQILQMISQICPAVAPFAEDANNAIWQKVEKAELPMNQAIAQCAYQTDRVIGAAPVSTQALQTAQKDTLLKAWIAMDYYCYVLKADYSQHLRGLQAQIEDAVLNPSAPAAAPASAPVSAVPQPAVSQIPAAPVEEPALQPDTVPAEKPGKTKKEKKKKEKKKDTGKSGVLMKILIPAVLVLVVAVSALFLLSDTAKTKASIQNIGTVTLESGEKIEKAEEQYAALSDSQKEKVTNRDDLFAARSEYDSLVTEDLINQIGTVTMESLDAIVAAEESYEALTRESKNLVDNYKTLTDARKEYTRLDTAVKTAANAIDAIGTVTLESGERIEKAREAYDSLKADNLQSYVADKVTKLSKAEGEFLQMYSQDLYDTGIAHHGKGEYEEAIAVFETILTDYPDAAAAGSARTAKAESQIALVDAATKKRDYYTAMQTLETVDAQYLDQETYQAALDKITAGLNKNRPKNGATVDGKTNWGYCYFQLTAGDQDVCFKFQNIDDPSKYAMVYVRAGQTKKFNVEDGTYSVKWATGEYWFDTEHHFGNDTVYRSRGKTSFTTTREGSWIYYWKLDLDLSDPDIKSNPCTAKDF